MRPGAKPRHRPFRPVRDAGDMRAHASDFAEQPYPGERPGGSYVLDRDGSVLSLAPDGDCASGWRVRGAGCLDEWLVERGAPTLRQRVAVLSYGSNASPSKVLRNATRLPAINLRADVVGLAAVWCSGPRHLDGAIPATLTPWPDHREAHVLSYVLPEDLHALDSVEGHPLRYERRRLERGSVVREDGLEPDDALAYVGVSDNRVPVLDESGRPVLVSDGSSLAEAQARAQLLVKEQG